MQLTGNVIIADDERHVRHYISLIVRTLGPETVYQVSSGEEAIALFDSLSPKPRLVILDINMPGIGGIETLRRLRGEGATCAIVMVTSLATRETVEDAIAAGATAYIRKDTPKAEITALLTDVWNVQEGQTGDSEPADVPSPQQPSQHIEESSGVQRGPDWDKAWWSRGD
jgi:DNA-binding NarL/FixJ family response regulator